MTNDFGKRMRYARECRDMTQTALADRLGWQPSAIGHFEAGRRKPGLDNLKALCQGLSVSGDYLLGLSESLDGQRCSMFVNADKLSSSEIDFIQTAIDAKVSKG